MPIESKIIDKFDDLKNILIDKTKVSAFYLLLNDNYLKKITKNTMITREVFTYAKEIIKTSSKIKYITLKVNKKFSIQEIYEIIEVLRKNTKILVTIYNPKIKEIVLLFINQKEESLLEKYIQNLFEVEEYQFMSEIYEIQMKKEVM